MYWIGGGSGAGKSTVARRLAAEHDLRLYSTDKAMRPHAARLSAEEAPLLAAFAAMDLDERWALRSPREMLETFHWFAGEGFELIVDDVRALPPPVLVEGFRLLPHLVAPGARAVWLLPTPAFRRAAFESRDGLWDIAGRTNHPERALRNLLERDALFTDHLRGEVARLGRPSIEVEVGMTEDALTAQVAATLGLA